MFDLKLIRETPDVFDSGWKRRGLVPQTPAILSMDETHRAELTAMENVKVSAKPRKKMLMI